MLRFRLLTLSISILSILILSTFCLAAAPDRITAPIASAKAVRLTGGVPLQARPKFDQGPVAPSLELTYVTLLTVPSAAQQKELNKFLADQENPHSASYHKWLAPEQYADRFGLSSNDIKKLTTWLQSQGFTVVRTARGRNWIVFSGTAAQVERTFQTEIHSFKVNGETHFANIRPPAIPAALSGVVTGVRGLNNFRAKSQARHAQPHYTFAYNGGDYLFIAPGDIGSIYNVNALSQNGYDGSGYSVAVIGETGIFQSDLTNFRQNFGLSAINCTVDVNGIITACDTSNFEYVLVNGTPEDIYSDLPEADIDIEWSGATAPGAQVIFVTATDPNGNGIYDAIPYAIDNDVAPVMTLSYTAPCELAEIGFFASDEALLQEANSEGITFMNSAGDTGVAECDYGDPSGTGLAIYGYSAAYPASSTYVTGVGGTLIPYTEYTASYWNTSNGTGGGSAKGYIPEQPWNDTLEFAYYCEADNNKTSDPFCSDNGIGGGPLLTDWLNMQTNVFQGVAAGSGGPSNCVTVDGNGVCNSGFEQPAWQSGISTSVIDPSGSGLTTSPTRFTPDVSLLASADWPGYLVCTQLSLSGGGSSCDSPTTGISDMLTGCLADTGPCTIYGGTSVASPIFAGMVVLLNQYLVTNGVQAEPGLGNINPMLYQLAATPDNEAFNQVTSSSSGVYSNGAWCQAGTPTSGVTSDPWPTALQCPSSGTNLLTFDSYNADATTGYNLTTGLGSVNLGNLTTAWFDALSSDFTLANTGASTETVLAGQSTSPVYSFTVTPVTGTTFTQNVTFACSFAPTDPTLTNGSCTFDPKSIPAGTNGAAGYSVTMSITTAGPNPNSDVRPAHQQRRRADNRLPWLPLTLPLAGVVVVGVAGRRLSRYSTPVALCAALILVGLLIACGSSSSPPPIMVSDVVATPPSLYPNDAADGWPSQTSNVSVTIANDSSNQGVTWSALKGSIVSTGATTATYTAPTIVAGLPPSDTITATSVADPSKFANGSIGLTAATVPQQYTVTITVTEGQFQHALSPAPTITVQ